MKKIYILIDEWTEPCWYDRMIFVFDSKEKAIAKMNERRDDFLSHEDEDCIEEREDDYRKWKYDDDLYYEMSIEEHDVL